MFTRPRTQDRIWRYLNFKKFDDLVKRRALYFARADLMSDHLEGIASPFVEGEQFREIGSMLPPNAALPAIDELRRHIRSLPSRMYLSCWHLADCESPTMWGRYSDAPDCEVAIQSTFGRLEQALPHAWDHAIHAGRVRYINDESEAFPIGNAFDRYVHKRLCFADERELRVMFDSHSDDRACGIHVPVDLQMLIECVYVSPTAPGPFRLWIKKVLSMNGLRSPVRQSQPGA